MNLAYRQKYAPEILADLKDLLDEIEERGDLLPKSELQEAITYLRNEWNAVKQCAALTQHPHRHAQQDAERVTAGLTGSGSE